MLNSFSNTGMSTFSNHLRISCEAAYDLKNHRKASFFSTLKFMKQIVILVVGHLIVRITLKFLFGLSFLFLVYFFPVLND